MIIDIFFKSANFLSSKQERFTKTNTARRDKISRFCSKIEHCLTQCVERLENNQEPYSEWRELKSYSEALFDKEIRENEIKELTELRGLLINTVKTIPKIKDIDELKKIAVDFKSLSNTIHIIDTTIHPNQIRRDLLLGAVGAGAAGGFFLEKTGYHPLSEFPSVSWKMQTFLGSDFEHTILHKAPQEVCDLIRKMTNDRFNIELDRGEEKGEGIKTEDILKSVSESSEIQCGYSGIYYDNKNHKALYFGSAIPFGLSPQEQTAWLYYVKDDETIDNELGFKPTYIQSLYRTVGLNIIPFPAGATGSQMGGWFKRKVESKEDLRDKTIRIPGIGADILRNMGMKIFNDYDTKVADNSSMSITDAIEQLKNDKILAVEWASPHDDLKLGLHEAAGFYYSPGWWEPSNTFDIQVNIDAWKNLSPNYQEIFKLACHEIYTSILAEYDTKNGAALKDMKELYKVEFCNFTDEIIHAAHKETLIYLESIDDKVFKEAYDEWKRFKSNIRAWSDLTGMDNYSEKA
jgi:TRAP-type mannitol/chloroaromatic compound transport system substrate-binding protein